MSLQRRVFLFIVYASICALTINTRCVAQTIEGDLPPNVLVIIADDLRPQLGCYGDSVIQSPSIDAFAEQAIRFDHAYAQSAVCSPSRNSLLSGLRPNTTELRGFGVHVRDVVPDVITLPQHFKNNGYHTQGYGKIFHIYVESMLGSEDDPESWSVPLQLPTVPVWGPEQNALRNRLIDNARAEGQAFDHPHDWPRAETWDDSDVADEAMQDGEFAAMAEAFLQDDSERTAPFFLAVGFVRPHLPFNAPRKYWELYDPAMIELPAFRDLPTGAPVFSVTQGIVRNYHNMPEFSTIEEDFLKRYLLAYYACISYVDSCTGRVLDALANSPYANNTIVVFLGDHGYQMGEYDSWGHKHANFEISTRTPLLVRVPGLTDEGSSSTSMTELLDIYPTLCELAGLSVPEHVEGKSFASVVSGRSERHREFACSEMIRRGRVGRSLRTENYRYTEWRNSAGELVARELYDHRDDQHPGELETENVVENERLAQVVDDLSLLLHQAIPHVQ